MDIFNFDINSILEELWKKRKLFHGETDLQFEIAKIIEKNKDLNVRVEHPFIDDKNVRRHIDILVTDKEYKNGIAIELKYKTTNKDYKDEKNDRGKVIIKNEPYILGHQEAKNDNCYYTLRDVERLQNLVGKELKGYEITIIKGYVIFITNDIFYRNHETNGVYYKCVSLHRVVDTYTREFSGKIIYKNDEKKFPNLNLNGIKGIWKEEEDKDKKDEGHSCDKDKKDEGHSCDNDKKLYTLIFEIEQNEKSSTNDEQQAK